MLSEVVGYHDDRGLELLELLELLVGLDITKSIGPGSQVEEKRTDTKLVPSMAVVREPRNGGTF